jgi:hypothetical protein
LNTVIEEVDALAHVGLPICLFVAQDACVYESKGEACYHNSSWTAKLHRYPQPMEEFVQESKLQRVRYIMASSTYAVIV